MTRPDEPGLLEVLRRWGAAWLLVWRAGAVAVSASTVLAVVAGLAPVGAAWLTKVLLDRLATGDPEPAATLVIAAGIGFAGLATVAVPQVSSYVDVQLGRRVDLYATDRLFTALGRDVGLARFENPRFHDRLELAQQASQGTSGSVVLPSLRIVQGLVTVVGFTGAMIALSPGVAVIVLLLVVPLSLAHLALSRRQARLLWSITPGLRRRLFYSRLLTDVGVAKEVRLFGLGGFLRRRMLAELRATNDSQRAFERRETGVHLALAVLGSLVAAGGLLWAVREAVAGRLTIGDVAIILAAVAGLQGAVTALAGQVAAIYEALLVFGHYLAVVEAAPDLPAVAASAAFTGESTGIEFDDVWFRYDDAHDWVLRGVTLRIPPGRATALVGLNGAGKSTLVKLLCRFYDPQRGAIRWDGTDLRHLDPADLRHRMSAVFQDHVAYELTAAENVGLGDLSALDDRRRIERAATAAAIHETLRDLPRGYDTMLSRMHLAAPGNDDDGADPDAGVLLSGGQWQRVALARAYLRDGRDLLILDEPTAGLDPEAEHRLHEDLRRHRAGRTSLLISHRLSAVRDADLIVALAGGRVGAEGTHSRLIDAGGDYSRLFAMQAAGYLPPHPA